MKSMKISFKEALELDNNIFIDLRSEDEFNHSHITNAINIPILDNLQRHLVGLMYKENGKEKAVDLGYDLTSNKVDFIINQIADISKTHNVSLYCARGGMRSSSVYNLLLSFKFKNIYLIEEGYKGYRNYIISSFSEIIKNKKFYVLQGNSGTGKTKILRELNKIKVSVLNLELLAKNSGSVFGEMPYNEKVSQKQFENDIFYSIYNSKDIIFTESENKRISNLLIPQQVYIKILKSDHILIETNLENRVQIIKEDYLNNIDKQKVKNSISKLKSKLGNRLLTELEELIDNDLFEEFIKKILVEYYDKYYNKYFDDKLYNYIMKIEYSSINEVINKLIELV